MRLTRHSWEQLGANQHEKLQLTTKIAKKQEITQKTQDNCGIFYTLYFSTYCKVFKKIQNSFFNNTFHCSV